MITIQTIKLPNGLNKTNNIDNSKNIKEYLTLFNQKININNYSTIHSQTMLYRLKYFLSVLLFAVLFYFVYLVYFLI